MFRELKRAIMNDQTRIQSIAAMAAKHSTTSDYFVHRRNKSISCSSVDCFRARAERFHSNHHHHLMNALGERSMRGLRAMWFSQSTLSLSSSKESTVSNSNLPDQRQISQANKYRKALCAVINSPKMFHNFQGLGIDILDVYITKDGKLAKVLFTTPFKEKSDILMKKLKANAGKLKGFVSGILGSKNTPRLEFVDADAKKMEYAREDEEFLAIERERREKEKEEDKVI